MCFYNKEIKGSPNLIIKNFLKFVQVCSKRVFGDTVKIVLEILILMVES